jgi:hypothetical protein
MLFWFLKLAIEGSATMKKTTLKQKTARKRVSDRTPAAATSKKTPTKTARPAVPRGAVRKPAVAPVTYQFDVATVAVPRIMATKIRRDPSPVEFASFDDAKDRAIDFLIDYIAVCEQQLWDLKRAESYEAYAAFLAAAESQKT